MAENITTVLNLKSAGDLSGDDVAYVIQGTGEDRDRKATLSQVKAFVNSGDLGDITASSVTVKATDGSSAQTEITAGEISLSSAGGGMKLLAGGLTGTGDIETAGDMECGTLRVKSIEGQNEGSSGNYVTIDNATVTGDLDVKGTARFGNSLLDVSADDVKVTVNGDLEVAGNFSGKGDIDGTASFALRLGVGGVGRNVGDTKHPVYFKDGIPTVMLPEVNYAARGPAGIVHGTETIMGVANSAEPDTSAFVHYYDGSEYTNGYGTSGAGWKEAATANGTIKVMYGIEGGSSYWMETTVISDLRFSRTGNTAVLTGYFYPAGSINITNENCNFLYGSGARSGTSFSDCASVKFTGVTGLDSANGHGSPLVNCFGGASCLYTGGFPIFAFFSGDTFEFTAVQKFNNYGYGNKYFFTIPLSSTSESA